MPSSKIMIYMNIWYIY